LMDITEVLNADFGHAEVYLGLKARGSSVHAEAPSERSDAEPSVV